VRCAVSLPPVRPTGRETDGRPAGPDPGSALGVRELVPLRAPPRRSVPVRSRSRALRSNQRRLHQGKTRPPTWAHAIAPISRRTRPPVDCEVYVVDEERALAGCPVLDPFSGTADFPPHGGDSVTATHEVPQESTAANLTLTVDILQSGKVMAKRTAKLGILQPVA
jgi:hypothetical protein